MPKVIAVYDKDIFVGYIESSLKTKTQGLDLVNDIWNSKTYLSELNANKAIDAYKSRGFKYDFRVENFEL